MPDASSPTAAAKAAGPPRVVAVVATAMAIVGALTAVATSAGAPEGAAGSRMAAPPTTPVVDTFTIPASVTALPTISADGDTVAWSAPDGGEWTLRAAVGGTAIVHVFDRQRWPVDVSVGHATGGDPVVLFSKCKTSKAPTRVRAQGCDLYRLSSVAERGAPVLLSSVADRGKVAHLEGASTRSGSETAPSLAGHWLLFARTNAQRLHGSLVARDTRTGVEHLLPHGDLGHCSAACAKDGFAAGAPLATSIAGTHFAVLWESINGPNALGIAGNDQVLRGSVSSPTLAKSGPTSFVSGTDSAETFGSVQSLGGTTQLVRHRYDGDGPPPSPGSQDVVERISASGTVTQYADPAGRRIVAAAAAGNTLWLIHDVNAIPAGTASSALPPRCSAAVGGCAVESIPYPAFTPVVGSA